MVLSFGIWFWFERVSTFRNHATVPPVGSSLLLQLLGAAFHFSLFALDCHGSRQIRMATFGSRVAVGSRVTVTGKKGVVRIKRHGVFEIRNGQRPPRPAAFHPPFHTAPACRSPTASSVGKYRSLAGVYSRYFKYSGPSDFGGVSVPCGGRPHRQRSIPFQPNGRS